MCTSHHPGFAMSTTMTVRIDDDVKDRLDVLAEATQRSKSFLAAEAIREYVELNEWQIHETRAALKEADAGGHDAARPRGRSPVLAASDLTKTPASSALATASPALTSMMRRKPGTKASPQVISEPKIAIASSPATRDTALLMPDAVPAASGPAAFITVVVSGATVTLMPSPSTT